MFAKAILSLILGVSCSLTLLANQTVEVFPAKASEWKQAGPGQFKIADGVATATGGMGLWWYAGKSFKNATIHLEFSLPDTTWNSGIFVRFPDPGNNPWVAVREGYEVQISGDDPNAQTTGAIFDTQAPSHIPLKKPGEWNNYQITTFDRYIIIVLNGELINVFTTRAGRGDQKGYFGLQNHDPKSAAKFRNIRVQEWNDTTPLHEVISQLGITRANWNNYLIKQIKNPKWYQKMDVGPALAGTFTDYHLGKRRIGALKGLGIELSKPDQIYGLFDTETLRFSYASQGRITMDGTPWTSRHGANPILGSPLKTILSSSLKPGWADKDGSFAETRKNPGHGNLAKDHARFRGHYRHGEQIILDYLVLGSQVLEKPSAGIVKNHPAVFRQFNLAPCKHDRTLLVADQLGAILNISNNGQSATLAPDPALQDKSNRPQPHTNKVKVITDRTNRAWNTLSMGAPSNKDSIDRAVNKKAYFRILPGFTQAHGHGGDEEGVAVRLNDGLTARNDDDVPRSFFFANNTQSGRLELSLDSLTNIERIHIYSWHKNDRSPQRGVIYGAAKDNADATLKASELEAGGWIKITDYDTTGLGNGSKHGVAVLGPKNKPIGKFSKLLFICNTPHDKHFHHTFYSEIDVYTKNSPELQPRSADQTQTQPLLVTVKSNTTPQLKLRNGGDGALLLSIPANTKPIHFSLGHTSAPLTTAAALAQQTPAPRELKSLTQGGPALFPESITTQSNISTDTTSPWVTDTVGLPSNNPWYADTRFGDIDFFSSGDSAAACTWNGDVWIISGLKGDWKELRWRRYATGLFETLGIKIVDDVIYVHGRDQITRLHDLNKDGEADWYECFNNDVLITANFHEFAFNLQTDKEGNFYIAKGAPVLAGGRGFDTILPHNGIVARIPKDGKGFEVLATGLRAPGGIAVGPNGEITTGENEGSWQPCCKLNYFTGKDKFLGTEDTAQHLKGQNMHPPLCYLPMRIDNSGGAQVWTPEKSQWGLKSGELIHLSYGQSALYRVLKEEVNGIMQGGVVRIPFTLGSSAQRARFHQDGSLYVLGFRGWQTNAATPSAINRIRHNQQVINLPDQLRVTDKGVYLRFEKELDPKSVGDRFNFTVKRWKYIRSSMYGSGEFSIDHPDLKAEAQARKQESHKHKKHDKVAVVYSTLLPDQKTVFLHIPSMKKAEQMSIRYQLDFADKTSAKGEVVHTVHAMTPHSDASLLQVTASASKEEKNLKPGLIQSITIKGNTDHRISRLPAQYVSSGDAISDMLTRGQFTSKWSGYLKLDERMTPQFKLEGHGSAKLIINDKEVLSVTGGTRTFRHVNNISEPIKLDPGTHSFELRYTGTDDLGHIRVLWKTDNIPLQSIPATYFHHPPHQDLMQALALRQGRDLLLQQKCTHCHTTDQKSFLPEHKEQGPDMKGIGSRVNQSWLAQWLSNPHGLKPNTTMPAFVDATTEQGRQDAADMAAYLALLNTNPKNKPTPNKPTQHDPKLAKQGGGHFHMLGCIACHNTPDQATNNNGPNNQRVPLNNINTKFSLNSLTAFLKKPDRHHASIKMPDFQLSDAEASQLAHFLHAQSKGKGHKTPGFPRGDVARGKKLVVSHNCAACHNGLDANPAKLPDFNTLLKSDWTKKGCVSNEKSGTTPRFNLTDKERRLLENYRTSLQNNPLRGLTHTSTHDYTDRQFNSLQCAACHSQDNHPSLLENRHSLSLAYMKGLPTHAQHKVDQTRPHLSYIGEMLHTNYIEQILAGTVKNRPRPWLAMRMPSFHSRAHLMAQGFSKQHGMVPSAFKITDINQDKAKTGAKLIVSSGGFACTICHANGDQKALAAFEVEGINFAYVAERLRPGYYHRWMENPASITPNTKMPRYINHNKSPLSDYDGNGQKQFDAILEYLKSLEKKKP